MNAFFLDRWRLAGRMKAFSSRELPHEYHRLNTRLGVLRLRDTGGDKPVLMIVPDGPNVIEHYDELIALLRTDFRIVCFDLPGFGFSFPKKGWDYSYAAANALLLELMAQRKIEQATFSFPCANGFYALAFAEAHPQKVSRLVLVQTPAMSEMKKWTDRTVPKILRIPLIGQIAMGRLEETFAKKWYNYALPRERDREPWQSTALQAVQNRGCFCLASLSQGLKKMESVPLSIPDSMPALLIHGEKDFTHQPTDFGSARAFRSDLALRPFADCGHFPDLEAPAAFAKILKE
ncbi:MAG: alpha/beta fold hydrolase [Bacteroidia bacterium]